MNSKILLVDDDEDELFIFKEALKAARLNIDCVVADSGEHALVEIEKIKPDFVFTDVNMPGMSGFELSRRIKNQPAFYNLPVIIYSGAVDTDTSELAHLFGATGCIKKSATVNLLARSLTRFFHAFKPVVDATFTGA